ncbi:MAG TPA: SUMF1/EgtB/PvdO family nonheme iron enzyme [Candidatus Hydrogenedentes bacterium]|nr:SUMF1/EgtB/PvdO family nonheme iron enzyme [Candidatus Hydrogenedentota bacterium]
MRNITPGLCHSVLLCVFAVTLPVTWAAGDVSIPDPGLESAIRDELGLGPTDPITETALAGITHLYAKARGIVDLTGLEYCTRLREMTLENNQISDLTPLQGLTSLTWLVLSQNCISDLSSLLGLTYLEDLYIKYNPLNEVDFTQILQLVDNGVSVEFYPYSHEYCPASEGEGVGETHPADQDADWSIEMSEAIGYLSGWQQGDSPMDYAIRAVYLWQNGEYYSCHATLDPPMCWMLPECPELVDVPAGTFQMGDPWNQGGDYDVPVHDVYLDAYRIGKSEVTNQEYADVLNWAYVRGYLTDGDGGAYLGTKIYAYGQFIADTQASWKYSQIAYSDGVFGVRSRTGHDDVPYSMADHPMVEVSWYGAVCYCNWLSEQQGLQACYDTATWTRYEPVRNGYRLPTEAEWERAAAWDGSRHWRYSMTSDTLDITRANYRDDQYEGYANPLGLTSPYTTPVGWYNGVNPARVSAPDTLTVNAPSPVGAYDMSGNVWEWCHDWYDETYYQGGAMTNPLGPSTGTYRVPRGGSWEDNNRGNRSACRVWFQPAYGYNTIGFRVAMSVSSR